MNMTWLTWELTYALEEFWVLFLDLLLCFTTLTFFGVSFWSILDLEVGSMDAEFGCCGYIDCVCISFLG